MENTINPAAILPALRAIIEEAATMSRAYFFNPPTMARARRSYEQYHSHPEVSWTENGHTYTAKYTTNCTCSNVYAYGTYTRDGKKTTLTAIKNSYARLMAAAAAADEETTA